MAIILVLAGLILGTCGYVQNKGARSRAEAEIAAMSAALENYKADNGIYPHNATDFDARCSILSNDSDREYEQADSNILYRELYPATADGDRTVDANGNSRIFML